MIRPHDILTMAKAVHRSARRRPKRRLIHPMREWLVGVGLALVVIISGAVVSANQFFAYLDIESRTADVVTERIILRSEKIEDALTQFNERTGTFTTLRQQTTPIPPEVVPDQTEESSSAAESETEESETDSAEAITN
jgi:hypothetical protein